MDGEIGRFEFKTYNVVNREKKTTFKGISKFPAHKGRQWYPSSGFKEVALILGAAQRSYRQTVRLFNRSCYQEIGGTPLNTLRDVTQTEGLKVLDFMSRKTEEILKKHEFSESGVPEPDCAIIKEISIGSPVEQALLNPALIAVCADMAKKGFSAEDISDVQNTIVDNEAYENVDECVYVHIDDVGVKEQKEHRNKKKPTKADIENEKGTTKDKRPTVQNTVARIEHRGKGFTLTGRSVLEVLKFVLAFLLNNKLVGLEIMFCTDGQRSLQDSIISFFSWHTNLSLLLDWFHVVKKFKEDLSLACKGRAIRNQHLKALLPLLWFGLIDKAQLYLTTIPIEEIKNISAIERLQGYLERNRKRIPCYAMRSKLNLPNSSNAVERCNNLVTAKRQKHQGMSWSEDGSYALTALNALVLNKSSLEWIENHTISFELLSIAA